MHIPVIGHVLLFKRVMTTSVVEKGHMLLFFFIFYFNHYISHVVKKYQLFLGRYSLNLFSKSQLKVFRFANYIDLFQTVAPRVQGF